MSIVFRCDDFLIIEKAAGMNFHTEEGVPGVIATLASEFPYEQFYPVHRLDKMTSGLLIVARHAKAAAQFGEMFEKHQIEKRYIALSRRKPKKKQGTVKGGMQPSRRGQWKLSKEQKNIAITQFFSFSFNELRAFYIRPMTGKTHQIRVALKSLGAPILGDTLYGGEVADRGYLHAYSLSFEWLGEKCSFYSQPDVGVFFQGEFADFISANFVELNVKWPSKV